MNQEMKSSCRGKKFKWGKILHWSKGKLNSVELNNTWEWKSLHTQANSLRQTKSRLEFTEKQFKQHKIGFSQRKKCINRRWLELGLIRFRKEMTPCREKIFNKQKYNQGGNDSTKEKKNGRKLESFRKKRKAQIRVIQAQGKAPNRTGLSSRRVEAFELAPLKG